MEKAKEMEPMYVESLLTQEELKACSQLYTTYNYGGKKHAPDPTTKQKWRYKMGSSFTPQEIANWNKNLQLLLNTIKIQPTEMDWLPKDI